MPAIMGPHGEGSARGGSGKPSANAGRVISTNALASFNITLSLLGVSGYHRPISVNAAASAHGL
jgi:hypothetical protein